MRIVFIGPPGAGKGTQALRVAAHLGVAHLSTGEILREACADGRPIGERVQRYLEAGRLVSDDIVLPLVAERLKEDDCRSGCLFDGFPRTRTQAEALDAMLADDPAGRVVAVEFLVPEAELYDRLAGRGRSDDKEATVRERLRQYSETTSPLTDYYDARGLLQRVDAVGAPDDVFARVIEAIEGLAADD